MFHRKMIEEQIKVSGVRLGDSCSIFPYSGKKKAFTLNRHCIDLISHKYRPNNLALSYVELPNTEIEHFHYRLELDQTQNKNGRYVLKTIKGRPFWVNGLAAKEAYIERMDKIFVDDNKINFNASNLLELSMTHFDHPILRESILVSSDLSILIQGETGTGKTHLASKIHQKSGRRGNFIAVNLSSFNPNLIESELFGHKKGSFTGATLEKNGAFSMADEGTLFLDEVDSLPMDIQTKILTFLDNRRYRKVGEMRESSSRARLIFASGRELEQLVNQGVFRRDLFYRLKAGQSIDLLPLRNDMTKITEACQFFALHNGVSFSGRLLEFYQSLAWPGNLRQLFGHLEKKKVLSRTTKMDFDLIDETLLKESSDLMNLESSQELISMEKHKMEYVKHAVGVCEGNIAMAARKIQLNEKTVRTILAKIS